MNGMNGKGLRLIAMAEVRYHHGTDIAWEVRCFGLGCWEQWAVGSGQWLLAAGVRGAGCQRLSVGTLAGSVGTCSHR